MMTYSSQLAMLASMTLTATTDSAAFTPGIAVEIISWGFIVTTALSGTPMVVTGDKRITAGTDTGRITGTATAGFGIMSPTAAQITASVAGFVLPSPATTVDQKLALLPGQQMLIKPGTGMGTAGAALPFIEYKMAPTRPQFTAAMNLSFFGVSAVIGLGNEQEIDA